MASAAEKHNTSCVLTVVIRRCCLKISAKKNHSILDGKQWCNYQISRAPSFHPLVLQWCKNTWLKKKTCPTHCLYRWINGKYSHSSSVFKATGSFFLPRSIWNSEENLFFEISYRKHFVPARKFTNHWLICFTAVNFGSLDCTNSLLTFIGAKEYLISHNYMW